MLFNHHHNGLLFNHNHNPTLFNHNDDKRHYHHDEALFNQVPHQRHLIVINKIDLASSVDADQLRREVLRHCHVPPEDIVLVSCRTGEGVQHLLSRIAASVERIFEGFHPEHALVFRERHRQLLASCVRHLDRFQSFHLDQSLGAIELAAEELRQAAADIGRVSGRIDIEEVLDQLFSEFCIGK